jgi:hypothetical protein
MADTPIAATDADIERQQKLNDTVAQTNSLFAQGANHIQSMTEAWLKNEPILSQNVQALQSMMHSFRERADVIGFVQNLAPAFVGLSNVIKGNTDAL